MVNLRERISNYMLSIVCNDDIHQETEEAFEKVDKFLSNYIPRGSEADEEVTGLIIGLENVWFKAGANMVLDFITGKDVE